MNKSDLRTGMLVTLRNGNSYYVMLNTGMSGEYADVLIHRIGNDMGWMPLRNYSEDLRHHDEPDPLFDEDLLPDENSDDAEWDIMEVLSARHPSCIGIRAKYKSIWKREE